MSKLLPVIILGILFSCTKKESTPEGSLKTFIDYRFSNSQDKEDMMEMVTGDIQADLEGLDANQMSKFLNPEGLRKKGFSINIKNCTDEKCYITYTLKYVERGKESGEHSIEVKKVAELWKRDDVWRLAKVSNVKTYIDSKKAMDIQAK